MALAMGLKKRGYNPLVVDIDPQASITYTMGADEENHEGIFELMQLAAQRKPIYAQDYIQKTDQGDILSSSIALSIADLQFSMQGREYLLKDILTSIEEDYDHIIIDTPPTLGILTINALTASDDVVIPMGAEILSLKGMAQLFDTIQLTQRHSNPKLHISGILITKYNGRTTLAQGLKSLIEQGAGRINTTIYNTMIRSGIAVQEAQLQRTSLFDYAPKSNPAVDYMAFIDEYIERGQYRG